MTSATISTASAAGSTGATTGANRKLIGNNFDTFLRMLTTQMTHQNPLSPMDTHEFTTQLVQFSQVEQLMNMSRSVERGVAVQESTNLLQAASLAGHLELSNLCWIYDDNKITIEGETDLAFTENVALRFKAYGWLVVHVDDANDLRALNRAIRKAQNQSEKPALIIVNSHIGFGAPTKQDTAEAHGAPLQIELVLGAPADDLVGSDDGAAVPAADVDDEPARPAAPDDMAAFEKELDGLFTPGGLTADQAASRASAVCSGRRRARGRPRSWLRRRSNSTRCAGACSPPTRSRRWYLPPTA